MNWDALNYFNPLHREGGDHISELIRSSLLISIHSTARVETKVRLIINQLTNLISIHSTARVETCHLITSFKLFCLYFNPLHREGGDNAHSSPFGYQLPFQSTPPRGWRHPDTGYSNPIMVNFNPLHREGGDGSCSTSPVHLTHFNPLHREGGDQLQIQ